MPSRYDIVVYGATGYTGAFILRTLATVPLFNGKTVAVAGRSESKLRAVLDKVEQQTGKPEVRNYAIILADSSDEQSLASMAKQAKVIINAVGPFILYGEPVVRAAIENGACHVDLSAEIGFLEGMALKYGALAKEKGVHVVGACGVDAIPTDMGTDYLKRNFDEGTLAYVETCWRINRGPAGYSFNVATFDGLLLGIKSLSEGGEAELHRSVIPEGLPATKYTRPFRSPLTKINETGLETWAALVPAADDKIIERSQYYDYHKNGQRPVQAYTYFALDSFVTAILLGVWLSFVGFFALFGPTRRFLSAHPDLVSFGLFKKSGPTSQQIAEATTDYFVLGTGWAKGEKPDEVKPTKKVTLVFRGPDPGYTFSALCVCASALTLVDDKDKLPKEGGVYTTATAFRDTRIFEYLKTMGITFEKVQ